MRDFEESLESLRDPLTEESLQTGHTSMGDHWGSDTPASMPVPPSRNQPPLIDMGGFAFTAGGIGHNITQADIEELSVPHFSPPLADDVED